MVLRRPIVVRLVPARTLAGGASQKTLMNPFAVPTCANIFAASVIIIPAAVLATGYIDSYDWVMVPNVYGMTQFADGGLMTTKPYISGSNYLLKMGDWDKGAWQQVWDGLFWRFMHAHRDFFVTNPRLGMLVKTFDKMPAEKREAHLARANDFLKQLDA